MAAETAGTASQTIALGVPAPIQRHLLDWEEAQDNCGRTTEALSTLKNIVNLLEGVICGGEDKRKDITETLATDVDTWQNERQKGTSVDEEQALAFLDRTRNDLEAFQTRSVQELDVLRKSMTDAQARVKRSTESAHLQREQDFVKTLGRVTKRLRQISSRDDDHGRQLYALLKTCVADVDKRCRKTQASWMRAQTQLVGSNVWALAWPEAARVARIRAAQTDGPIFGQPPGYQTDQGEDASEEESDTETQTSSTSNEREQ
ncbi:hypothetical protein CF319_g7862 [Tilletia indica]|nr:hypothetical protein CF319_g7862 [Tilletia indica]